MLIWWAGLAVDFDVWVEFFGEAFQIAETHVFAWKFA
jgi:hypothetical protein